jgi:alkylation response protein AidB-like acyl-CoA dehydrogenase
MTAQEQQDEFHDIRDAVANSAPSSPANTGASSTPDGVPEGFVDALTEAGYLSVLIPEEYGGSGLAFDAAAILEEIQRAGCNGGGCHAQMYTMDSAAARQRRPEGKIPAGSPAANCACRRSASPSRPAAPTPRH